MSLLNVLSAVGAGIHGAQQTGREDEQESERKALVGAQLDAMGRAKAADLARRKAYADALKGMHPTDADPPANPNVPAGTGAPVPDPNGTAVPPTDPDQGGMAPDDAAPPPAPAGGDVAPPVGLTPQLAALGSDLGSPSKPDTDPDTGKPAIATAVGAPTVTPPPASPHPAGVGPAARGKLSSMLGALPSDPIAAGDDPEVLYNAALKAREDEDRDSNTKVRLGTLAESVKERQGRENQLASTAAQKATEQAASNHEAYVASARIGAPEAQGPYNPNVHYADVYSRYNTERNANRSDATARLAAGASGRANDIEARKTTAAENATRSRGALLTAQLTRLPASDQQVLQQTVQSLKAQNPQLDDNMAWGLAGDQYEKMQSTVADKPRLKPLAPKPPPGSVPVTDPVLQAEILRQRGAAGRGGQ